MKYIYFLLFTSLLNALNAQHDTLLLPEAEVWDSSFFKKTLGQQLITLTDVMQDPGADMSDAAFLSPLNISTNGPGLLTNAYMRGTHADGTQLFWNGMPVNSPTLGTSDLSYWYPAQVEEILLLPGGSGAELGSGSIGGSIFMNNKMEFKAVREQRLLLNAESGSFGRYAGRLKYALSSSKNALQMFLFYDKAENNFTAETPWGRKYKMPNAAFERRGFNLSYQHRFKKAIYQSYLMMQELEREIPDARSAFNPANPSEAFEIDKSIRWQNRLAWKSWKLEQGFNYENQFFRDLRYGIMDTNNFLTSATELNGIVWKGTKISWNAGAFVNHTTAYGSNINQSQVEYGFRTSVLYRIIPDLSTKLSFASVFLDDKQIFYRSAVTQNNGLWKNIPVLPSLSVEYRINKNMLSRGKAGMVYNIPTLNERYWPLAGQLNILPEIGFSSEAGYDYIKEWGKWKLEQNTTLYYMQLTNKIIWLPANTGVIPVNIDETFSRGAELSFAMEWSPDAEWKLKLSLHGNYTDSRVLRSLREENAIVGNHLIFIPILSGGGRFTAGWQQWQFFANTIYNSGAYTTSDNDELSKLKSFIIWDAGLGYLWTSSLLDLSLKVKLNNLSNTDYELFPFRPNPGINYQLSLTSIFKL